MRKAKNPIWSCWNSMNEYISIVHLASTIRKYSHSQFSHILNSAWLYWASSVFWMLYLRFILNYNSHFHYGREDMIYKADQWPYLWEGPELINVSIQNILHNKRLEQHNGKTIDLRKQNKDWRVDNVLGYWGKINIGISLEDIHSFLLAPPLFIIFMGNVMYWVSWIVHI